jgi:hypothetical protein
MRGFGIFLFVATLLLVAAAAYLKWFRVSVENPANGSETTIAVSVDKDRVQRDLATAREKARGIAESAAEGVKEIREKAESSRTARTITGEIVEVGKQHESVTVSSAQNQTVLLMLEPQTTIQIGGKDARPSEVEVGQKAVVTYSTRDGRNVAQAIRIAPE